MRKSGIFMPLTARFTETVDEYRGGQIVFSRFFSRNPARLIYRHAYLIGSFLVAGGIVGFGLKWNLGFCILLAAVGCYLMLSATVLGPRRVKRDFAQYPDHGSEKVMEFSEEKLLVHSSHGKSEMDWARFSRFIETEKLFVLFAPPRFLLTVPKRAIVPNDSDQLRELLKRKLPTESQ
jgi:hypothetical protein